MSFILDALRKSEHARQRQTGPGLAEVPVAAPKSKTNVWATAAVALLVVNLLAVGVLLLRRAQQQDSTTAAAAANPTLVAPPPAAAQTPAITQSAQVTSPRPAANDANSRNPLADEVGTADEGGYEPSLQSAAAAVPAGPPAVVSHAAGAKRGSVVYAPVPEAADAPYAAPPAAPAGQPAAAPARDTLPGADELTARGSLPALHLDLHVYATQPQQRFIFVNSRKYREGDTLAEGPVVEQITADGAVLNFRGSRFKLAND
ncbi:MAG: general secretion pathway protein GspB [Steroidobacteraceae bacterium]